MELLINVDVDDLPRGIGFYQEGLGLRLSRKLFDDTVAEMTGGATPIYLLVKPAGTRPTSLAETRPDYRRHWTPVALDFFVDNLQASTDPHALRAARAQVRRRRAQVGGPARGVARPVRRRRLPAVRCGHRNPE